MLDELLVTAQLVEVRVGLAEILQVKLVLQLVAHDDRHHSKKDLEYVVND